MYKKNSEILFKAWLIIILSCSFLLLDGCSALQDLAQSIQKPRLSVTDVHVAGFDFNGMELVFDVTVDNPNALSVQMMSYDYNLDINEKTFVSGRQEKETRIEASGKSIFEVPMRVGFSEVYATVENLAKSDEAAYEFVSRFAFDLPGLGRTEVPVRKKGEIPLLRLPAVRVNNLQVNEISLNSAKLTLNLEFDNPNGVGFNINNFDYSLNINGSKWAEGSDLEGISIPENDVAQLDIPIQLNIAQMGVSAFNLLTGSQNVDYELNGNFSLGADHPLLGETTLMINRDGRIPLVGGGN